jgi:hypothetical protein
MLLGQRKHVLSRVKAGTSGIKPVERDDIRLDRKGSLNRPQIRFNLLAGKEASMDGETLLRRSA